MYANILRKNLHIRFFLIYIRKMKKMQFVYKIL